MLEIVNSALCQKAPLSQSATISITSFSDIEIFALENLDEHVTLENL